MNVEVEELEILESLLSVDQDEIVTETTVSTSEKSWSFV